MYILLVIALVALFGYSLVLVLTNNAVVSINLLFSQVPAMNVGLVLIISLILGVAIGMLLSLVVFRVFQMKLEIGRLKKDKHALQTKLDEANIVIEQSRKNHAVLDTHTTVLQQHVQQEQ